MKSTFNLEVIHASMSMKLCQSGVRSCSMTGVPRHLVQELNVGTVADHHQGYMRKCETMVKLLCHASLLKSDDVRLLKASFCAKSCIMCDNAAYEDANHMIMQCSYHSNTQLEMYDEMNRMIPNVDIMCSVGVLLGKCIDGWEHNHMVLLWMISFTYIA